MNKKGFTLLEILLSVGAIAILAAVVIVAINPGKQLATARNTTRLIDVHTIADAIYQYTLDHDSTAPAVFVSGTYAMLGTSASGCATTCNGEIAGSTSWNSNPSFTDQTANDFNAGTLNNVVYDNTNSGIKLTSGTSGNFTSRVFDSTSAATTWSTLIWTPLFPSGKELPNNGGSETGYANGNVNMTGNMGLWHLNENSGATSFTDNSGNNNTGTCQSGTCPTLGATGKLNTAATFDGNSVITIPNSASVNVKGDITLEAWIKPTTIGGGQVIIAQWHNVIIQDHFWFGLSNNSIVFAIGDGKVGEKGLPSITQFSNNAWYHVVGTWTTNRQYKLYVNGILDTTGTQGGNGINQSSTLPFQIGRQESSGALKRAFIGTIDETAVYNRALSATEILDHYRRGAARLKLQARSCADAACNGANFIGPDGTANTYYSELTNTTLSPQNFSLNIPTNRYFQYKAFLESDSNSLSPLLKSISVSANVPVPTDNSSGDTADACLDLSSTLVNGGYVSALPFDPKLGSAVNSFYAVKAADHGKVMVKSCRAELGQDISTVR